MSLVPSKNHPASDMPTDWLPSLEREVARIRILLNHMETLRRKTQLSTSYDDSLMKHAFGNCLSLWPIVNFEIFGLQLISLNFNHSPFYHCRYIVYDIFTSYLYFFTSLF